MRHDISIRLATLRRRRTMLDAAIALLEEYRRVNLRLRKKRAGRRSR